MARLLVASPEAVLAELSRPAADERRRRWGTLLGEELEEALAKRQEPLIDLALAQFAASRAVVARLLGIGLRAPDSQFDAVQRRGLRVACYANERLDPFMTHGLLHELAPEVVIAEIVASAPLAELAVLLRNPVVGDKALVDLYRKSGPFEGLDDDRWRRLVELAALNPRIVVGDDDEQGPDFGFWDIHKALFGLVCTAPATEDWCYALQGTLARIHPPAVAIAEPINATIGRWRDLKIVRRKGEPQEGIYTNLPLAEEFVCILAAVYGTRFVESRYEHAGTPASKSVAERCAYYGGAKLTKKDVERFSERDGAAFDLAVVFNDRAILDREVRAALEDRARYPTTLFRERVAVIARRWKFLREVIARWETDDDEAPLDPGLVLIERLEQRVTGLAKQVRTLGYLLVAAVVMIALLVRR